MQHQQHFQLAYQAGGREAGRQINQLTLDECCHSSYFYVSYWKRIPIRIIRRARVVPVTDMADSCLYRCTGSMFIVGIGRFSDLHSICDTEKRLRAISNKFFVSCSGNINNSKFEWSRYNNYKQPSISALTDVYLSNPRLSFIDILFCSDSTVSQHGQNF